MQATNQTARYNEPNGTTMALVLKIKTTSLFLSFLYQDIISAVSTWTYLENVMLYVFWMLGTNITPSMVQKT